MHGRECAVLRPSAPAIGAVLLVRPRKRRRSTVRRNAEKPSEICKAVRTVVVSSNRAYPREVCGQWSLRRAHRGPHDVAVSADRSPLCMYKENDCFDRRTMLRAFHTSQKRACAPRRRDGIRTARPPAVKFRSIGLARVAGQRALSGWWI